MYSFEYEGCFAVHDSIELHTTGVGCNVTRHPDGSACIFMYSDKGGPLPMDGRFVRSVSMARRAMEGVWKNGAAD